MRIGIFGGSFNPPHTGHVRAAIDAVSRNNIDLLIVIPAGTPPHKTLPENSPDAQARFLMTKNAFDSYDNVKISDIEIFNKSPSYTIDTVRKIRNVYPGSELLLLVGSDMFETLSSWKDSDELLKLITPVFLSRETVDISSSRLREMLPLRKGNEFLSGSNYAYIIKHRLYNAKPNWDWLREQAHLQLNPLRIPHVDACEAEVQLLAKHWGVDADDAREAAILHDITKKLDFSQNMCIIAEHGKDFNNIKKHEEKLLHSITGALLAKSEYGVSDNVASAIKWHTTGKSQMSMLEKIVYIADYIEATRDFPGVDNLRRLAYDDIDKAMVTGLEMTVSDLTARGIVPNASTFEALQDLKNQAPITREVI